MLSLAIAIAIWLVLSFLLALVWGRAMAANEGGQV